MRCTLCLFAVVLGASAMAAAAPQNTRQAHRQTTDELREAAKALLDVPFEVEISILSWSGIRFEWIVRADGEIAEYLQEQRIEPADDRVAQFTNWATRINSQ